MDEGCNLAMMSNTGYIALSEGLIAFGDPWIILATVTSSDKRKTYKSGYRLKNILADIEFFLDNSVFDLLTPKILVLMALKSNVEAFLS
jgi:hypothetical protein